MMRWLPCKISTETAIGIIPCGFLTVSLYAFTCGEGHSTIGPVCRDHQDRLSEACCVECLRLGIIRPVVTLPLTAYEAEEYEAGYAG